jgi:hypothetical protein
MGAPEWRRSIPASRGCMGFGRNPVPTPGPVAVDRHRPVARSLRSRGRNRPGASVRTWSGREEWLGSATDAEARAPRNPDGILPQSPARVARTRHSTSSRSSMRSVSGTSIPGPPTTASTAAVRGKGKTLFSLPQESRST